MPAIKAAPAMNPVSLPISYLQVWGCFGGTRLIARQRFLEIMNIAHSTAKYTDDVREFEGKIEGRNARNAARDLLITNRCNAG
jgi:hypothetical protein